MDKNAIKKFAVWARREMIERVSQKAMQYGIEKDNIISADTDSVGGKVLTDTQKNQRKALISQINAKGYEEVIEEVAYTWFNRLIALRFMEVNGYLPTRVRVFTDEENNFKPQIIDEALHLDLDGLNMDKVYEFKNANQTEELYKYLLITQCNALNSVLPGMFQRISDYTELLLPDNLLREGSVIEQMISTIPEEDWQDAVQIIGWLYQYYNAEKKDEVFAALKKNVKITKENIPAATQLFTPDWIVRYMVENSLGRLWVEGHPNDELKAGWKYYLDEAEQEPEVQAQLAEIRKEYAAMTPDQIKCIDPCCGSGHILVYLFDVLVQIYESYGYTTREAVESIVKNNLYGLDIDDRAAQLTYFAVMMKARQYDRRFFIRQIQPNVYAIQESNGIDHYALEYFCNGDAKLKAAMDSIITEMHDAKEYGSILNITPVDFSTLYARFDEVRDDISMSKESVLNSLLPLVQVAEALAQKYDVVVTNPPYMGNRGMGNVLNKYISEHFCDSKSDMFAVFLEKGLDFLKLNRPMAYITMQSWLFLASYDKVRFKLANKRVASLLQIGFNSFPELNSQVAHAVSFVIFNNNLSKYTGKYFNLNTKKTNDDKEQVFLTKKADNNFFSISSQNFLEYPNYIFAFWLSKQERKILEESKTLGDVINIKQGLATGNNNKFLRDWYEVEFSKIGFGYLSSEEFLASGKKYAPYNKGGDYRKWYGNCQSIVNWENDGFEIKYFTDDKGKLRSRPQNVDFYFRKGITWSLISTNTFAARLSTGGFIFDVGGSSAFMSEELIYYVLGLLCSKVTYNYLSAFNPTINFQIGDIKNIPFVYDEYMSQQVISLVKNCVDISKSEWDTYETSWDYKRNPVINISIGEHICSIKEGVQSWKSKLDESFKKMKKYEESINEVILDIYGLSTQYRSDVSDKTISIRKPDESQIIKALLSYAVGCMFGRYSLDVEGLVYAGGEWDNVYKHDPSVLDPEKEDGSTATLAGDFVIDKDRQCHLCTFAPDKDNIIPICDDEYFDDDIVGRFVKFIEVVYGKDTLEENLKFIADTLGGKGQPREVIRNYFLNDFYADHCKIYQKRPIYWLFDSGKKNGFKALIYMHRYQPDTIARIRTDYVHEQQSRYRTAISDLENRIANAAISERVKLNKALTKLKDQDTELRSYEEKIHHLADQMIAIDLDDGVKVNYEKFQDVLAKIK